MKNVKYRAMLRSRLRDTRGFMLGEHLISILFIGLLCVAVTAGLQAAMNSYSRITVQTKANAMLMQAVEEVSDELTYALEVEGDGVQSDENPLYFTSSTRHEIALLQSDGQQGIWLNAEGAQALLAPAEDGLTPRLEMLSYNDASKTWSFELGVYAEGDVAQDALAKTTMNVLRIGS